MFKIESGIPAPAERSYEISEALQSMVKGDSFLIPKNRLYPGEDLISLRKKIYVLARRKTPGLKFSCKIQGAGLRVWRIK